MRRKKSENKKETRKKFKSYLTYSLYELERKRSLILSDQKTRAKEYQKNFQKKDLSMNSNFPFEGIHFLEDFHLEGKSVFLRLDLNIPLEFKVSKKGKEKEVDLESISKNHRLQKVLPTLRYLLKKKCKIVIGTHLGRPKMEEDKKHLSLEPIARSLGDVLGQEEIVLSEEPVNSINKVLLSGLKSPKQILMLENLRFDEAEEKNLSSFAEILSECVDIYINEAFGASHRKHASIDRLPRAMNQKGMGPLMKREIEVLNEILNNQNSSVFLLGGNKVKDKVGLIKFLTKKENALLLMGGRMAYTFLSASGVFVDPVNVEKEKFMLARDLFFELKHQGKKFLLPLDHKVRPIGKTQPLRVTEGPEIEKGWLGVDIGPKTLHLYKESLMGKDMIFWNGPMGIFEQKGAEEGTFQMIEALAKSTAFTVIGGGNSAAAAQKTKWENDIDHISTGGGASLVYLQEKSLPGIEALKIR